MATLSSCIVVCAALVSESSLFLSIIACLSPGVCLSLSVCPSVCVSVWLFFVCLFVYLPAPASAC